MDDLLPGDRSWWRRSRWWRVPVALAFTIVLTTCGIFWLAGADHPRSERGAGSDISKAVPQYST